jgi:hypothetical protein
MIERVYVIYCPQKGSYWSKTYQEFKGELYASKYKTHSEFNTDLESAVVEAKGFFVEIKDMYYYNN